MAVVLETAEGESLPGVRIPPLRAPGQPEVLRSGIPKEASVLPCPQSDVIREQ